MFLVGHGTEQQEREAQGDHDEGEYGCHDHPHCFGCASKIGPLGPISRKVCVELRTRRQGLRAGPIVVEQDTARWRVDVVELAGTDRPHERSDGAACDQERERKHDVERDHGRPPRNARERSELPSTVSELAGIRTAAMSGWMTPAIASAPTL